MTSPLDDVYKKYKHLDQCLSDPDWCEEGKLICEWPCGKWAKWHDALIAARAVKEAREVQQEITPSADIIADLERSLDFYRTRMNNLQCWQSSMRDPERKIVCDILANGFTLTTKEEIDNAGNPCAENGCTDIGNCDEICQHSRIYSPVQMQQAIAQATVAILNGCPNDLRMNGWMVAVHNDYRQNGEQHTFWLLTHKDGTYVKGEGKTDAEALNQIRESIHLSQPKPKEIDPK